MVAGGGPRKSLEGLTTENKGALVLGIPGAAERTEAARGVTQHGLCTQQEGDLGVLVTPTAPYEGLEVLLVGGLGRTLPLPSPLDREDPRGHPVIVLFMGRRNRIQRGPQLPGGAC